VIHAFSQLEMARVTETKRGLGTFVREDVNVEGIRLRILQEAALRFLTEVHSLGLSIEDAQRALEKVSPNGQREE
jgi:GntR family transcriptional regulator